MAKKEEIKLKKSLLLIAWASSLKEHYQCRDWVPFFKTKFSKFSNFSTRDYYFRHGIERLNEHFLELIHKEKPDYILISLSYDEIWPQTLHKIKAICPNTITIGFFGDDNWRFEDWSRYYAQYFDYVITSEKDTSCYKQSGYKNVRFLHGVSPLVFHPKHSPNQVYDISFVGMPIRDRAEYLNHLKRQGFNVSIFGRGWESHPELKENYLGFIDTDKYVDLINRTKINISFSKTILEEKGKKNTQLKGRLFEVAACKAFMLVEYFPDFDLFFPGLSHITFKTKEDLAKKVALYLENESERTKISEELYKLILKKYTWASQFNKFFRELTALDPNSQQESNLSEKFVELSCDDLNGPDKLIFNKLNSADIVLFNESTTIANKFRSKLQIQSLNFSSKPLSWCDTYLSNFLLGRYSLIMVNKAVKSGNINNLAQVCSLSQLAVKKDFLIKNLQRFRRFNTQDKIWLLDESRASFISIPLVQIKSRPNKHNLLSEYSRQIFLDKIYGYWLRKDFLSPYLYLVILELILNSNVRKAIFNKFKDPTIQHKLKNNF